MNAADDPHLKCYMAGVPRINYVPGPFRIFQNAMMTAIVYQDLHTYRLIPYDREPFEGYEFWIGKSQGHWEDGALIVETMRVVERFWLTAPNTMQYEARIEDPNVFTRPWSIRLTADRITERDFRIPEHNCLVNENGELYHSNKPGS